MHVCNSIINTSSHRPPIFLLHPFFPKSDTRTLPLWNTILFLLTDNQCLYSCSWEMADRETHLHWFINLAITPILTPLCATHRLLSPYLPNKSRDQTESNQSNIQWKWKWGVSLIFQWFCMLPVSQNGVKVSLLFAHQLICTITHGKVFIFRRQQKLYLWNLIETLFHLQIFSETIIKKKNSHKKKFISWVQGLWRFSSPADMFGNSAVKETVHQKKWNF